MQHRVLLPKSTQNDMAFEGERTGIKVDASGKKGSSIEHLEGDETEGDGKEGMCYDQGVSKKNYGLLI